MTNKDLKDIRVGDEVLVDTYDYAEEHDAVMREVVTEVTENSICTLDYTGGINYYSDGERDLEFIKGKTGRNFPEIAEVLKKLKEGDPDGNCS